MQTNWQFIKLLWKKSKNNAGASWCAVCQNYGNSGMTFWCFSEKTNKKTKQDLILAHCKNNVNQTVDFVFECSKINSGTLEKPLEPLQWPCFWVFKNEFWHIGFYNVPQLKWADFVKTRFCKSIESTFFNSGTP